MSCISRKNKPSLSGGFTLVEIMVASMLIGMAIASLMMASGAFTNANGAAINLSTAEFLIEEIRELSTDTAFDDLSGLAGTYNPPIDISSSQLTDFSAFSQQVEVRNVSASDFTVSQAGSDFIRVTVTVLLSGNEVSSASWIRAGY